MVETRAINWRCGWCGNRQGWLRALTRREYCTGCAERIYGNISLHLQSGAPLCPQMDRADDHHAPMELLIAARDRPARRPWWIRALCQHCVHLSPLNGSWCCECGSGFAGLPIGRCVVCDVGGRRR